jgi:predicted ATPase
MRGKGEEGVTTPGSDHLRIGQRLEDGYQGKTSAIAGKLAVLFEQGQDYQRAVSYLQQAGENALLRSGHREASGHFTKALELLDQLPISFEHNRQQLVLSPQSRPLKTKELFVRTTHCVLQMYLTKIASAGRT